MLRSVVFVFIFLTTSVYAAAENEIKMVCKPKPGCQLPSCDRPEISSELLAIAAAAGLNVVSLQQDNEYSIICQPSSVLDLFSSLANVEGKAGAKGEKGTPGPRGIQGPAGIDGSKGENGADGNPGTTGQKGDKGEVGKIIQGPKGNTGSPGVGMQGPKGSTGPIGPKGPAGKNGATGPPGARGRPGPPGSCSCGNRFNSFDRGP
ncbi:uncharacterized protein LOC120344826 [Styela clava]